jgi:hypothetical protein
MSNVSNIYKNLFHCYNSSNQNTYYVSGATYFLLQVKLMNLKKTIHQKYKGYINIVHTRETTNKFHLQKH